MCSVFSQTDRHKLNGKSYWLKAMAILNPEFGAGHFLFILRPIPILVKLLKVRHFNPYSATKLVVQPVVF